ncbi:MAG: hypothetical protein LBQ24_03400 [Candidatus Peribacteria bacterium]|nr:hypothetical protein [Candidatus Peribacteria bacterium]
MSDTSYLTSTTYAPSTGSSRSINFSTALIGATSKATAMRVVCVSDSN